MNTETEAEKRRRKAVETLGRVVVGAYPDAENLLDEPDKIVSLTDLYNAMDRARKSREAFGDTLLQFICIELLEGTENLTAPGGHDPQSVVRVMTRAIGDLHAVLGAVVKHLEAAGCDLGD